MSHFSDGISMGELIDKMEAIGAKYVRFDFPHMVPTGWDSYRGYYEDVAIGYQEGQCVSAASFLTELKASIGTTMQGYKGGAYPVLRETAVWVSRHGESDGVAIVGVREYRYGSDGDKYAVLETRHVD